MAHLQGTFEGYLGKDVVLFTVDGWSDPRMLECGTLPTLFATVDFASGKGNIITLYIMIRNENFEKP